MSKDFTVSVLMDFYGELLTEKQVEVLDFYYNQDFSLNEIAEQMNISRQGVRDFIKKGEKQLFDMEGRLHLAERFQNMSMLVKSAHKTVSDMRDEPLPERAEEKLSELEIILDKLMTHM